MVELVKNLRELVPQSSWWLCLWITRLICLDFKNCIQLHQQQIIKGIPRQSQWSIRLEYDIIHRSTVTFLMQYLILHLQVPQPPRVVKTITYKFNCLSVYIIWSINIQQKASNLTASTGIKPIYWLPAVWWIIQISYD